MSNPAVIVLARSSGRAIRALTIEDNIGEAIHVHVDAFRWTTTVHDFLTFSSDTRAALQALMHLRGLDIDLLDHRFLVAIGSRLPDLVSTTIRQVRLSELRCAVYVPALQPLHRTVPIEASPVYRYLKGDRAPYLRYGAKSGGLLGDPERLASLVASLRERGFDDRMRPLVIFNGRPVIMDGQHRACCVMALEGDRLVNVLDLQFRRRARVVPFLRRFGGAQLRAVRGRIRHRLRRLEAYFRAAWSNLFE